MYKKNKTKKLTIIARMNNIDNGVISSEEYLKGILKNVSNVRANSLIENENDYLEHDPIFRDDFQITTEIEDLASNAYWYKAMYIYYKSRRMFVP